MTDKNKSIEQTTKGTKVARNWMLLGALWDGLAEDLPDVPGIVFAQIVGVLVRVATIKGVRNEDVLDALIAAANDMNEQLAETKAATP
jgi:hypothetical protein